MGQSDLLSDSKHFNINWKMVWFGRRFGEMSDRIGNGRSKERIGAGGRRG